MKKLTHTIRLTLAACTVLLGTVSCLDKYPASAIPEKDAMRTFSDAEQHRNGIYAAMKSSALYSGLLTLLPDIQSDLVYAVEGNTNTYGNFWLWQIRSVDEEIEAVYSELYSVIRNCNFYLERIDEVMNREIDDAKLEQLQTYTGEVYAMRALCYSELIKCFCKAYDPDTAQSELGVVLRTKYFTAESSRRASLNDSYQLVIEDLKKAEEMLDEEDDITSNNYLSAGSVQALRARVALYMQDWETAIEYASKLIDRKTGTYSLASHQQTAPDGASYFDYMWAYDSSPEVIWRVGFTETSYGGKLGTVLLNFTRDFYYFYPDYVTAKWVLDAYDTADLRYGSYFITTDDGIEIGYENGLDWPLLVKYYGNRQFIRDLNLFHVSMPKPMRLAEQYLIRAEAYCNLPSPNFPAASKDITALRQKRYSGGGALTLASNNWKEIISEERVRELLMEGFRLQDLKRWHQGFERKPQQCSQGEGSSLKIAADNPLFVWPIPQHELETPGSEVEPNESNK